MNKKSLIYIVAGLVLLGGLYFVTQPQNEQQNTGNNQPTPVPATPQVQTFNINIAGKKLVSGPQTITVAQGDEIKLTITTDETDELHLHGYDKIIELVKNVPTDLAFTATITGRFVYELENAHAEIGVIEVLPK